MDMAKQHPAGAQIPKHDRMLVDSIAVAITRDGLVPADGAESSALGEVDAMDDLLVIAEARQGGGGMAVKPEGPADGAESAEVSHQSAGEAAGADLLLQLAEDGFVSALAIVLIPGEYRQKRRRIAAVAQPMGFVTKVKRWLPGGRPERVAVLVPPRYVTDFASIPNWAHAVIHPFGRHAEAAVVHDWLYTLGPSGDARARLRADRTFCVALKLLGVGPLKRFAMFAAVRLGGSRAFGSPEEFDFRRLNDLRPVDPKPNREPYQRTFSAQPVARPRKA